MNDHGKRLPSLDGWRAICIAFVLIAHSVHHPGFPDSLEPWVGTLGYRGVRFFFIISGFLITFLMLKEYALSGNLSLKDFYIRRVLRIFPVYMVYLLVIAFLTQFSQPIQGWISNFTFTTDFLSFRGPTVHLWSLAVEEQFYIIWPCLVFFVLRKSATPIRLLYFLIPPMIIAPVVRLLDVKQWYPPDIACLFHSASFFAVFDWLAYGSTAAIIYFYWPVKVENYLKKNQKILIPLTIVFLLMPDILAALHAPGRLKALIQESFQAIGFVILMLRSLFNQNSKMYRFLNWKWVAHFGTLSYSIYVWHGMFSTRHEVVFGTHGTWCNIFPTWIIISILVAHLSYYLLEVPLMGLRRKFRHA